MHRYSAGFVACALALGAVRAEQLPIRTYTTAEGLPRNVVNGIVRDSRGFLWFATTEGLARFDGYSFTTYGVGDGLSSGTVTDVRETSAGTIWVATDRGLDRFNASPSGPRFTAFYPGESRGERFVMTLLEDRAHTLWCGTRVGLYRVDDPDGHPEFRRIAFPLEHSDPLDHVVSALYEDADGVLWVGLGSAVYRRTSDGRAERYDVEGTNYFNVITQFLEDRAGRFWMSSRGGLFRLVRRPEPGGRIVARRYGKK